MGCNCTTNEKTEKKDDAILGEVNSIFAKYDLDKDEKLSFNEAKPYIIHFQEEVLGLEAEMATRNDLITEMFTEIDTQGDNYIAKDALYNHLNRYIKNATLVLESQ